jgi:hypothetical protein
MLSARQSEILGGLFCFGLISRLTPMKFVVVACIIPTKIYVSFFKSHP